MRLFVDGHSASLGYAISAAYSDAEIRAMPAQQDPDPPVRFVQSRRLAFALVERWNRRFARW